MNFSMSLASFPPPKQTGHVGAGRRLDDADSELARCAKMGIRRNDHHSFLSSPLSHAQEDGIDSMLYCSVIVMRLSR